MPRLVRRARAIDEPTTRDPLRFGAYERRYSTGLSLIVAGAVLAVQTSSTTIALGALGSAAHLAGWLVLPGRALPRWCAAVPSMVVLWVTLTGPKAMALLALPLVLWLVARRRPPVTWVTAALPIAIGWALGQVDQHAADRLPAFAATAVAVVAAAWIARSFALRVEVLPSA